MKEKNSAFTLAEVLITLGIIGIIAALTMPALIANHRKKLVGIRLKKFYSSINQAIKMAEVKNGDILYWEYPTRTYDPAQMETWINKYLAPELKIIKTESNSSIFYIYSPDGYKAGFFVHGNRDSELTGPQKMHIYVYPFVKNKGNAMGKDFFTFFFWPSQTKDLIEPYKFSWDGTKEALYTGPFGCARTDGEARHYCTTLLEYNNWEVPDDYPYRF